MIEPEAVPPERHTTTGELLRRRIGTVLRRARQFQERTLSDVAAAARISMAHLSEVERGRKEASSEVLAAICAALELELTDLLTEIVWDLTAEAARRRATRWPSRRETVVALRGGIDPAAPTPAGSLPPTRVALRGGPAGFPGGATNTSPGAMCLAA